MGFPQQLKQRYPIQAKVAERLCTVGRPLLAESPRVPTEAVIRYLTVSILRSHAASITLVKSGFGADAIKLSRGMFEVLVTLRTLIASPDKIETFVYFDDVLRWKRLELYKRSQRGHPA
jgi:hypothetical protein